MQRVHFSVEDMARTRLGSVAGLEAETAFASRLFGRGGGGALFREWHREVRRRLAGPDSDLGPLPRPSAEDFGRSALSPYWQRILDYLELERESRSRIMLSGGVQALFTSLQPHLRWQAPILTIPNDRSSDTHLNGSGLLLVPSLFLFDRAILVPDTGLTAGQDNAAGSPLLIYPARLNPSAAEMLWHTGPPTNRALGALIGRTRAGALRALTDRYSTSELGQLLRISPAAASQHATTLRNAGLITTRRRLNTVQHTVTPLGSALIRGYANSP